jgi:hypothetical protein
MAKRLDLLPQPVVEEEEDVDMEAEEEMCDLVTRRTQKVLEWVVTERLAGRVTTDTTTACCWAAVLATAGPQKRRAGPPPSLRVLRSDKVKEEKVVEEMAQPPVKCVGREEEAPDATAAAQIGEEEDGRKSKQQSS